jgi:BirA family transcriptional regulator, biotin operon repressor / biotin---[acetyl-CoA-carboxylase] ligase
MESGVTDRRMDKLIHLLSRNATVVLPGPKIAEQIGAPRSTVWEWIEKLRAHGVEIKGFPSTGYRMQTLPDLLLPSLIREELMGNEIGHKIVHYFRTGSTNDEALKAATTGAPHGTVFVAEEQTSGRGRLGRVWFSEKASGIYCTVLLRPPLPPAAAPVLTLMAGLAAQRAIRHATDLVADIRWPNDLLLTGHKVAGILTEMNAEVDRVHAVVIGFGINVNHSQMPEELRAIASSLRLEGGRTYSRIQVLVSLLKELQALYHQTLREGSVPIVKQWAQVSSFASGKHVRVKRNGQESTAITRGLRADGSLLVQFGDGPEEALVTGEITELK